MAPFYTEPPLLKPAKLCFPIELGAGLGAWSLLRGVGLGECVLERHPVVFGEPPVSHRRPDPLSSEA